MRRLGERPRLRPRTLGERRPLGGQARRCLERIRAGRHGDRAHVLRPVAAALIVVVCVAGVVARSEPAGAGELVEISPASTFPGSSVAVRAAGLPPGLEWLVMVCGDGGLGGTSDCNPETTVAASSSPDHTVASTAPGSFDVLVSVALPPVPCPCVVAAFPVGASHQALAPAPDGSDATEVFAPITIYGASSGPVIPSPAVPHELRLGVRGAVLIDRQTFWQDLAEWFGGPARRTVVFRLSNTTSLAPGTVPLAMLAGNGPPYRHLMVAEPVRAPGPHTTEQLALPVVFPAFWVGRVHVVGQVGYAGSTAPFQATIILVPWLLFILGGLVVLGTTSLVAIMAIVRLRSGHARRHGSVAGPTGGQMAECRAVDPPSGYQRLPSEGRGDPGVPLGAVEPPGS